MTQWPLSPPITPRPHPPTPSPGERGYDLLPLSQRGGLGGEGQP